MEEITVVHKWPREPKRRRVLTRNRPVPREQMETELLLHVLGGLLDLAKLVRSYDRIWLGERESQIDPAITVHLCAFSKSLLIVSGGEERMGAWDLAEERWRWTVPLPEVAEEGHERAWMLSRDLLGVSTGAMLSFHHVLSGEFVMAMPTRLTDEFVTDARSSFIAVLSENQLEIWNTLTGWRERIGRLPYLCCTSCCPIKFLSPLKLVVATKRRAIHGLALNLLDKFEPLEVVQRAGGPVEPASLCSTSTSFDDDKSVLVGWHAKRRAIVFDFDVDDVIDLTVHDEDKDKDKERKGGGIKSLVCTPEGFAVAAADCHVWVVDIERRALLAHQTWPGYRGFWNPKLLLVVWPCALAIGRSGKELAVVDMLTGKEDEPQLFYPAHPLLALPNGRILIGQNILF